MQNQAAVEALYSATFVEDYMDTVENLPNDLQRNLSSLRELDFLLYRDLLSDLDSLIVELDSESTTSGQRQILAKIQKGLIAAQDIGDDKLAVAQALADTIENRTRLLEHSARNLEFEDDGDDSEEDRKTHTDFNSGPVSGASKPNLGSGPKRSSKHDEKEKTKRKKKIHDKSSSNRGDEDDMDIGRGSKSGRGGGAGTGSGRKSASATKRKASKRSHHDRDDSDRDIDLNSHDIDPDEPTYCLCDQVSYGDMIGCDNDLCPIEWFHFQCVSLSNKPKGRWFCPKCRGDKPTVMKPKAQFLKELEKYNREREEKLMKSNG